MDTLFHPKIATKKIWKWSLLITIVMVVWHLTLVRSHTPYMNSLFSWTTTIICPALMLIAIHIVVKAYSKSGDVVGESAGNVADGFTFGFLVDLEGGIAAIAFILLIPLICFLLPAEVALGIAYKKGWIDLFMDVWKTATMKEGIFIITKGVSIIFSGSFLAWEFLLQLWFILLRPSFNWANK